tara:strand:- start:3299 stop:3643 length:345 start_codon:yes stop_codon:yes gene_type:complete
MAIRIRRKNKLGVNVLNNSSLNNLIEEFFIEKMDLINIYELANYRYFYSFKKRDGQKRPNALYLIRGNSITHRFTETDTGYYNLNIYNLIIYLEEILLKKETNADFIIENIKIL